eukprot:TRINITY_DN13676_c0_g1_i1.p1 TRINITY_DN13676_c0_g1~~TRINITY_DN13676_c0_g1_i1.p1  ORF type:complete len:1020 (+),score=82.15 TRINITY_DN13676_c0_g1_i1:33-3092(+)
MFQARAVLCCAARWHPSHDAVGLLSGTPRDLRENLQRFMSYQAAVLHAPPAHDARSERAAVRVKARSVIEEAWRRVAKLGADADAATVGSVCRAAFELRSLEKTPYPFLKTAAAVTITEAPRGLGSDLGPSAICCYRYVARRDKPPLDFPLSSVVDALLVNLAQCHQELHRDPLSLAWWIRSALRLHFWKSSFRGMPVSKTLTLALTRADPSAFAVGDQVPVMQALRYLGKNAPDDVGEAMRRYMTHFSWHLENSRTLPLQAVGPFLRSYRSYGRVGDLDAVARYFHISLAGTRGKPFVINTELKGRGILLGVEVLLVALRLASNRRKVPVATAMGLFRITAEFLKLWRAGNEVPGLELAKFAPEFATCPDASVRNVMMDVLQPYCGLYVRDPGLQDHLTPWWPGDDPLSRAAALPEPAFTALFDGLAPAAWVNAPVQSTTHALLLIRLAARAVRRSWQPGADSSDVCASADKLLREAGAFLQHNPPVPSRGGQHILISDGLSDVLSLMMEHTGSLLEAVQGPGKGPAPEGVQDLLCGLGQASSVVQDRSELLGLWFKARKMYRRTARGARGMRERPWEDGFLGAVVAQCQPLDASTGAPSMRVVDCYRLIDLLFTLPAQEGRALAQQADSFLQQLLTAVLPAALAAHAQTLCRKLHHPRARGHRLFRSEEEPRWAAQAPPEDEALFALVRELRRKVGRPTPGALYMLGGASQNHPAAHVLRALISSHAQDFWNARRLLFALAIFGETRSVVPEVAVLFRCVGDYFSDAERGSRHGLSTAVDMLWVAFEVYEPRVAGRCPAVERMLDAGGRVLSQLLVTERVGRDDVVHICRIESYVSPAWRTAYKPMFRKLIDRMGEAAERGEDLIAGLDHIQCIYLIRMLTIYHFTVAKDKGNLIFRALALLVGSDDAAALPPTNSNAHYIAAITAFAKAQVTHAEVYRRLEQHALRRRAPIKNHTKIALAYSRIAVVTSQLPGVAPLLRESLGAAAPAVPALQCGATANAPEAGLEFCPDEGPDDF